MPFIETLSGTAGVPEFDYELDQKIWNATGAQYTLDNADSAIVLAPGYAVLSGYFRDPAVNADIISRYAPFRLLSAMLSQSAKRLNESAPKGIVTQFSIYRFKGTAANPNTRGFDSLLAREECMETYQITNKKEHFEYKQIRIIHAIDDTEFAFAKSLLETETCGAVYDMALSAMLTPTVQHNVRFYTRGEQSIILINRLSILLMYRIFALLPIIFKIDLEKLYVPIDPAIFGTLIGQDHVKFIELAEDWLRRLNAACAGHAEKIARERLLQRTKQIKDTLINGLANIYSSEIERKTREIEQAEASLKAAYAALRTFRISAITGDSDKATAFALFLTKFSDLKYIDWSGSGMRFYFCIETTLQHYEIQEATQIAAAYRRRNDIAKAQVIEALFVHEDYHVVIRQGFFLDFDTRVGNNTLYGGWSMNNLPLRSRHDAFWNPHLHYFGTNGCWGENGPYIQKALMANDPMQAFNQAVSAVRSIWLNDSTAANKLYTDIFDPNYAQTTAILRASDGARISCAQFLKEIADAENRQEATLL